MGERYALDASISRGAKKSEMRKEADEQRKDLRAFETDGGQLRVASGVALITQPISSSVRPSSPMLDTLN